MKYKDFLKDYEYLEALEKLHKKKIELKEKMKEEKPKEPFIVEFCGLPRTGKSVTSDRIYDFFRLGNFNVEKTIEPAAIIKRTHTPNELKKISAIEFNDMTLEISREELNTRTLKKPDIIIQDRGVIDNYFWYQMMLLDGSITEEEFTYKIKSIKDDMSITNQLYIFTANPKTIVLRDYINQIYLEDRKKTTIEHVSKLKTGIDTLYPIISKELDDNSSVFYYDTTNCTEMDTAIMIANDIISGMEKQLVKVKK